APIIAFQRTSGNESTPNDCESRSLKKWLVSIIEGAVDKDTLPVSSAFRARCDLVSKPTPDSQFKLAVTATNFGQLLRGVTSQRTEAFGLRFCQLASRHPVGARSYLFRLERPNIDGARVKRHRSSFKSST